jgi:hypothetical protein
VTSKDWLQGAGAAVTVLFPIYGNAIDGPSALRMHTPLPATAYALALATNLLLVSAIFAVTASAIRKKPAWRGTTLLLPAFLVASLVQMAYFVKVGTIVRSIWPVTLLIVFIFTGWIHSRWPRVASRFVHISSIVLLGLGFFCGIVLIELLSLSMWRPLPNSIENAGIPVHDQQDRPRVVWILFDELSYQQVFGGRYAGLSLPNFDAFREISTTFTDAMPAVNKTEDAVPSILLGERIEDVAYSFRNKLEVKIKNGRFQPFNSSRTPFAVAHAQGMSAGVVGWYNPYCGMLTPYLTSCYWTGELIVPSIFERENFIQELVRPWRALTKPLTRQKEPKTLGRIMVYEDLLHHSKTDLQVDGPDFVFLHLPLPHPPGFYDRTQGRFALNTKQSYIDSLALTDKTLGELLTELQQSPRWNKTSVVVCGDHSWRTFLWSRTPYWTQEDQKASNNRKFDPRPVIMVHLPGQTTPQTVATAFQLIGLHTVLDDLLRGETPNFEMKPAKSR